jgi:hypothetical protein
MIMVQLIRGNFMYGIDLEAQEKNWNGEGLPSVGDIINVFSSLGTLIRTRCRVDYIGDSLIICMDSDNEESCFNILAYTFTPTPEPAETAKQKAIDEMFKLTKDCADATDARLTLYEAGYTKSKVKPLSYEVFQCLALANDTHQEYYECLIENGYCIGSAD